MVLLDSRTRRAERRKAPGEWPHPHPAPYGARLAGTSIVSQALSEAVVRLVQLYAATGRKDEAAKWRKELDSARCCGRRQPVDAGDR